jgi:hypothetical protein
VLAHNRRFDILADGRRTRLADIIMPGNPQGKAGQPRHALSAPTLRTAGQKVDHPQG